MDAARLTLIIVAASYLVAAGVLGWMRGRGETVPTWFIAGWVVCGIVGLVAAWMVRPERAWAWWVCLAALGPWMVLSLVVDARQGLWWMVALDTAGVAAIAWAVWRGVTV